jgi:hypothetical protein
VEDAFGNEVENPAVHAIKCPARTRVASGKLKVRIRTDLLNGAHVDVEATAAVKLYNLTKRPYWNTRSSEDGKLFAELRIDEPSGLRTYRHRAASYSFIRKRRSNREIRELDLTVSEPSSTDFVKNCVGGMDPTCEFQTSYAEIDTLTLKFNPRSKFILRANQRKRVGIDVGLWLRGESEGQ